MWVIKELKESIQLYLLDNLFERQSYNYSSKMSKTLTAY